MKVTTFEFSIGEHGYLDEKGDYIERDELVEKFEWWLRANDKYFVTFSALKGRSLELTA